MTMTEPIYSISQINDIRDNGFIFELSENSLEVINTISEIVGAASYIRTPIFPKKDRKGNKSRDVEPDPNFKRTVFIKEQNNTVLIRSFLNKLTDKNFDTIYEEIDKIIKDIVEKNNIQELNEISDFIFLTAGTNKAFSKVYAKMYNQLIQEYNIFQTILNSHLDKHLGLFETVEVVSSTEDYNRFCDVNRINDERRSISLFISNLYNNNTIEYSIINNIITLLHTNIEKNINNEDKSGLVLEIAENSSIIIINSLSKLRLTDNWSNIIEYITTMCNRKMKDFKSLPSKSIFKYMDIHDQIKRFR
jgi:hypothetical protein